MSPSASNDPSVCDANNSSASHTISAYVHTICEYLVNTLTAAQYLALIDNGPIAGCDTRIHSYLSDSVNLNGINDHTVNDLRLAIAGGVTDTHLGPGILLIPGSADMRNGRTIICPGQMEHFGWKIHDQSPTVTGVTPYMESLEGYRIPIAFRNGLPYIKLRPYTDEEWRTLPKILASHLAKPWDPTCLDSVVPDTWHAEQPPNLSPYMLASDYDEFGELKPDRVPTLTHNALDEDDDEAYYYAHTSTASFPHPATPPSNCGTDCDTDAMPPLLLNRQAQHYHSSSESNDAAPRPPSVNPHCPLL